LKKTQGLFKIFIKWGYIIDSKESGRSLRYEKESDTVNLSGTRYRYCRMGNRTVFISTATKKNLPEGAVAIDLSDDAIR
jgi:hypothetical protein